jgi:hypothetical protein
MSIPKVINKKMTDLLDEPINKNKLLNIELNSMSDDDINFYFPRARILVYNELKKYDTIISLLPKKTDYIFLLFRQTENSGHWCLLTRHNNLIEFFDSYGNKSNKILEWTTDINESLGQSIPYLEILFNQSQIKVVYNPIDYQNKKNYDISTCGRHCCFRLYTILKYDMNLNDYYDMMKALKKKTKKNYDEIVSLYLQKL